MGNKKKSYEASQNEKELLQKELSSLRNSVQDIFSIVSHGSPISQDYNFEEKLNFIQESLTQKESLLKSSGEFMAVCNHRFEFDFLNQAGCTLLALSEEGSSKSFLDFVKEKECFQEDIVPKVIQKNGWIGELTIDNGNRVFPVACKIIPFG